MIDSRRNVSDTQKKCASLKNRSVLFENGSTEVRPNNQENPGARTMKEQMKLHRQHHVAQLDCNDGEVWSVLVLSRRGVGSVPMVSVPVLECAPFRIVRKFRSDGSAIEALIHRREVAFASNLIDEAIGCECRVGEPVANHDSCVAESKLIESVDDLLRARRHQVGVFEFYHSSGGIKLNIHGVDGSSISPMQLQPTGEIMSGLLDDDNGATSSQNAIGKAVAKCQQSFVRHLEKMFKNGASNHGRYPRQVTTTANHERTFVMTAISTNYKCVSKVANHDS